MDRGAMSYSPWGRKELDVTEHTHTHTRTHAHTHEPWELLVVFKKSSVGTKQA